MDLFNEYFVFEKSALRVTALPNYDCGEKEEIKAFMEGQLFPVDYNQNWCSQIKKWTNEGKIIERVRVVPKKIEDYTKFELMCFLYNTWAGEIFHFISEEKYKELAVKYQIYDDFWILDEKKVLILHYDNENDYTGCTLLEEADSYVQFYQELLAISISFQDYLKEIRKQLHFEIL